MWDALLVKTVLFAEIVFFVKILINILLKQAICALILLLIDYHFKYLDGIKI